MCGACEGDQRINSSWICAELGQAARVVRLVQTITRMSHCVPLSGDPLISCEGNETPALDRQSPDAVSRRSPSVLLIFCLSQTRLATRTAVSHAASPTCLFADRLWGPPRELSSGELQPADIGAPHCYSPRTYFVSSRPTPHPDAMRPDASWERNGE